MTPIEIMAFIVVLFATIKLLVVFISPKSWYKGFTSRFWTNPVLITIISLAVTVVTLIFLIRELTIVQIFAAMLFTMSFIILMLAPFSKDMLALEDKWFKEKDICKKGWVAGIVWIVLIIWVLYTLFA